MNRYPISAFASLLVEPVICYRGRVAGWALDMRVKNPFYTFWGIDEGRVALEWSGGSRRVTKGQAILIPAGLARRHRFAERTKIVSVSFWAGWQDGRVLLPFDAPLVARSGESTPLIRSAARVTIASAGRSSDVREACYSVEEWLSFHAALKSFVAEIVNWSAIRGVEVQTLRTGDARLDTVLKELQQNLRAGPLPFANWTAMSGLSRVQLDRLSCRWIGESLRRRRDDLLFQEIRRAVSGGRESLKEISARLGFFDAAHFHRWVKARAGRSPSDLRETWV